MANIIALNDNISCPISVEKIDERSVRLVAAQVVFLGAIFCIIPNIWIPLFFSIDFAIRAFTKLNVSVLGNVAKYITSNFLAEEKQLIDRAPKRFAAALGVLFSFVTLINVLLGLYQISLAVMITLLACAILEAFFAVCVGCYVYHFLQKHTKFFNA